jgi:hypothetical protein
MIRFGSKPLTKIMFIAKLSPSQRYWLPKVLLEYQNLGWLDVDCDIRSYSKSIAYEQADIYIRFEKNDKFIIVTIDYLGKVVPILEGEL